MATTASIPIKQERRQSRLSSQDVINVKIYDKIHQMQRRSSRDGTRSGAASMTKQVESPRKARKHIFTNGSATSDTQREEASETQSQSSGAGEDGTSTSDDADYDYDDDEDDRGRPSHFPPLLPSHPRYRPSGRRLRVVPLASTTSSSSASSASSSEDKFDSELLSRFWTRLQEQRQEMAELRTKISGQQKRCQDLRRIRSEAERDVNNMLKPHMIEVTHGITIHPKQARSFPEKFAAMQRSQADYNLAESEYERLQLEMSAQEKQLEIVETQFFTSLYSTAARKPQPLESGASISDSAESLTSKPESLLGISAHRAHDMHPLYKELLDAAGEKELAREHYTELLLQREAIFSDLNRRAALDRNRDQSGQSRWQGALSEEELNGLRLRSSFDFKDVELRVGHILKEDEREFLQEYEVEGRTARDQLDMKQREVERLRDLCIAKNIFPPDMPAFEAYPIFADNDMAQEPQQGHLNILPSSGESLADPRYPLLLSNPSHILERVPLTARAARTNALQLDKNDPERPRLLAHAMKEAGISSLLSKFAVDNKSDFINRWLLQNLRTSPLEVDLLYAQFTKILKVVNTGRWEEDVLVYWLHDGTNRPPAEFEGPITTKDTLEVDQVGTDRQNSVISRDSRPKTDVPSKRNTKHPVSSLRDTRSDGDEHLNSSRFTYTRVQ